MLAGEWCVPNFKRRGFAVVAKDIQGPRIKQEMLSIACRKIDPPRRKNAKDMTVREQSNISLCGADFDENAVSSRASLLR